MVTLNAYAKINLTLDVLGKRPDGYHLVDTILQSIDVFDTLLVHPCDTLRISVEDQAGGAGEVPADESNLACRAALLLQNAYGVRQGAKLELIKRIPVAAGLAGGSADAAAALWGLNLLWELNLSKEQLLPIAARLGADVPFCLMGGTARGQGTGTELCPLSPLPDCAIALCKPCEGMLTRDVFAALDLSSLAQYRPNTLSALDALQRGDIASLCASSGNVLESVTLPRRPQAAQAMERLMKSGALTARMSGSGPSVFALFTDEAMAHSAVAALPDGAYTTVTHPVAHGIMVAQD